MGNVIVITSGKGGTGKTTLTAGLGIALAQMGQSVLCIDCDIGLRNLDIVLGMTDAVVMDFSDVIAGRCDLSPAAVPHPTLSQLHLLTAPLSLPEDFPGEEGFRTLLQQARDRYDHILIDSPAGLDEGFRLAVCDADRAIVVVTHEPASLRDAQRVVGELAALETVHLVVNRVKRGLLRRMDVTIDDAMDTLGLPLLGLIPEDRAVPLAAKDGKPVSALTRKGAAVAFSHMARRLTGEAVPLKRIW